MHSSLRSLCYVSSASHRFDEAELLALLAGARAANEAGDVTGLLLHCGGNFMQVLEGRADAVGDAYRRVGRSRRHHGLIELFDEPIEAREFAGWSMASRSVGELQLRTISQADTGLRHQLLLDFWKNCR
ncbi:MAG TPA: BLUF domain-containing protein [Ramlibacter sp.]|jgi:hypothetical protein|uniref:BLUF domain-containing protein n=1 Tax=Ramlibacter sp. TaxID=1917967 RepID=UPI002D73CC83|nr:BLUF domain-containing protein [Ramlibacter sp.]HZY19179.1 BLUF domain-containing protein [Ramlibacter sp.]